MKNVVDNSHKYDYNIFEVGVMKKRFFYIILCSLSLCAGGFIYIIFRPDTIVTHTIHGFFPFLENASNSYSNSVPDFFKYYFPDFLWAFSFFCGLNAIFDSPKTLYKNCLAVLALGVFWELGQFLGLFSGTGDLADVLMYLVAVIAVVFVEKIHQKGAQK